MVLSRNDGQNQDEVLQNRFTAYLLSAVTRRKAQYIDELIRSSNASELIEDTALDSSFDLEQEAFIEDRSLSLQNEKLIDAINSLSERERYIFFNRALDEMSIDDLAVKFGLSYKGAAAVYYRTIQKIKKKMKGGPV